MKNKARKFLSFALASAMVLSLVPSNLPTYAAENDETAYEETVEEPTTETTEDTEVTEEQPTESTEASTEALTEQSEAPAEDTTEASTEIGNPTPENNEQAAGSEQGTEAASEEPIEEVTEETTEESAEEVPSEPIPTFDTFYDGVSVEGLDFSGCELLIGTDDAGIFTADTEVVSEYNGIYLTRYADATQTMNAYSYYYTRAALVEVNGTVKANDIDNTENGETEEVSEDDGDVPQQTEEETAPEEPVEELSNEGHGEADLSNLNNSNDAFSNVDGIGVANYSGYIALIDTGATNGVKKSVSVMGGGAGDDNGHGTRMANAILEANPNANIISIKALGSDAVGSVQDVYTAIEYAVNARVSVINLSMSSVSTAESELLSQAIADARNAGIIVVASAGNNGTNASYYTPGNIPGVITIGACDEDGERVGASNYGASVDYYVVAESTSIAAARFSGLAVLGLDKVEENDDVFSREYVESEKEKKEETASEGDADKDIEKEQEQEQEKEEESDKWYIRRAADQGLDAQSNLLEKILLQGSELPDSVRVWGSAWGLGASQYNSANFKFDATSVSNLDGTKTTENGYYSIRYESATCPDGHSYLAPLYLGSGTMTISPDTVGNFVKVRTEYGYTVYRCTVEVTNKPHSQNWQRVQLEVGIEEIKKEGTHIALKKSSVGSAPYAGIAFAVYGWNGSQYVWIGYMVTDSTGSARVIYDGAEAYLNNWGSTEIPSSITDICGKDHYYLRELGYPNVSGGYLWFGNPYTTDYSNANENITWIWSANVPGTLSEAEMNSGAGFCVSCVSGGKFHSIDCLSDTEYNSGAFSTIWEGPKSNATHCNLGGFSATDTLTNGQSRYVAVRKLDAAYPSRVIPLAGAEFKFYREDNGQQLFPLGSSIDGIVTTDANGYACIAFTDSYSGSVKAVEVTPPPGDYYLVPSNFNKTVTALTSYPSYDQAITNARPVTNDNPSYIVIKKDNLNNTAGIDFSKIKYHVYKKNGNNFVELTDDGDPGNYLVTKSSDYTTTYIKVGVAANTTLYITEDAASATAAGFDTSVTPYVKTGNGQFTQFNIYTEKYAVTTQQSPSTVGIYVNDGKTTSVTLTKESSNTDCTDNNPNYSLAGAEFKVFTTDAEATAAISSGNYSAAILTLTTKADGTTDALDIPSGKMKIDNGKMVNTTFYVVESKAPKGYLKSNSVTTVTVKPNNTSGNPAKIEVEDVPSMDPISLVINKVDGTDPSHTMTPPGDTTLEGAQFTLSYYAQDVTGAFNNSWTPTRQWVLETKKDASGNAKIDFSDINYYKVSGDAWYYDNNRRIRFPYGFFKVQETKAPEGFNLTGTFTGKDMNDGAIVAISDNSIIFKTNSDGVVTTGNVLVNEGYGLWKEDQPIRADIELTKVDENDEPMSGVEFKVVSKSTSQTVYLVTDENGYVSTSKDYVSHLTNTNARAPRTGKWFGDTSLADDSYGALFWDDYSIYEVRGTANAGKQLELVRTVTKAEIEANAGKVINIFDKGADAPEGKNWNMPKPVIRSAAKVVETDSKMFAQDNKNLNFDPHNQTIEDTVTYLNLKAATDYTLVSELVIVDKDGNVTPYMEKDASGNDIPYTRVQSFTTNANYTKSIYEKVGQEVVYLDSVDPAGTEGKKFVVYETLYLGAYATLADIPAVPLQYPDYSDEDDMKVFPVEHKDPTDLEQTVTLVDIHTGLTDNVSEDHIMFPKDDEVITDRCFYTGLHVGYKYTISGTLMAKPSDEWKVVKYCPDDPNADKDGLIYETVHDGKDTAEYELKDENGNPITASLTFTAEQSEGYVDLEFVADAALLAGQHIVAKEELMYKGLTLSVHDDIEDRDEIIYVPQIKTSTRNSNTNIEDDSAKEILATDEGSFTDRISYHSLIANRSYKAKGILMDKATGKAMLDADGKQITAETTFKTNEVGEIVVDTTPNAVNYTLADGTVLDMAADHADYMCNGTVDVVFEGYDFTNLANKVGVVFEEIYLVKDDKEILVSEHKKIDDIDQFTYFVKIGTKAKDSTTQTKVVPFNTDTVFEDTVSYKGLIPNKEYTLSATLVVKEDGTGKYKAGDKLLDKNGKEIVVTHTFTPTKSDGEEIVKIPINTSPYKDMEIVVFEGLYNKHGLLVGLHADLEDKEQTLKVPGGGTKAKDKETGDEVSSNKKTVTIVDTISFTNLEPGVEYTAKGTLYEQETKQPLKDAQGKEITNTVKFTPAEENGTVDVEFTIDASLLAGKTIVVFEDVLVKEKTVFIHHDIEDKNQTVYIPKIGTTATFKNGEKTKTAAKNTTIVDKCEFSNLVVGKEYKIKGFLYNKSTGEKLLINGQPVTAEKTFTPETPNGTVDLEFTFDASGLSTDIVVFEYVYHKDIEVATHTDINDKGQTVTIVPPNAPPKTGMTIFFILLGLMAVGGIGMFLSKKKDGNVTE